MPIPALDSKTSAWAGPLCHPVPLAAVLALVVNDHLLKGSGLVPGSVTGKLSDVAGLFFFPVLLAAVGFALLRRAGAGEPRHRRAISVGAVAATAAAFAALKLWPAFNALVERAWGANALDATDLLALPAVVLAGAWLWRARRPAAPGGLQVAAILAAVLASAATSRSYETRVFPRWEILAPQPHAAGCATATAWNVRSGKEGAAFALELSTDQQGCAVELRGAELRLRSRAVAADVLPPAMELAPGAARRAWLAFRFDGDRAWNAGERAATLELSFLVAGQPYQWSLAVENRLPGGKLIGDMRERDRPRLLPDGGVE
ncbi:MAG TPA: hypothetical protein VND93_07440 [Myxococcales bacterium]|nr:hypothetical protein [Myxococcales bacterium]